MNGFREMAVLLIWSLELLPEKTLAGLIRIEEMTRRQKIVF